MPTPGVKPADANHVLLLYTIQHFYLTYLCELFADVHTFASPGLNFARVFRRLSVRLRYSACALTFSSLFSCHQLLGVISGPRIAKSSVTSILLTLSLSCFAADGAGSNSAPEISTAKQLHLQTTPGTVTQNSHVRRRRSGAGRSRRCRELRTAAVIGWVLVTAGAHV